MQAHQVEEMFEKHAVGDCQCIEATLEDLTAHEWFGSDFYYEDNWGFQEGILQGYIGYVRFPEYFPLDDLEFDQADGYIRRASYDCEELFAVLRQCVCDTIQAACFCKADNPQDSTAIQIDNRKAVDMPRVALVQGMTRNITTKPVKSLSFCEVTGRIFCFTFDLSVVVFESTRYGLDSRHLLE